MKKYILRAVKIVALLLAVLFSTAFLQSFILLRMDHNQSRMVGYYLEEENSLDMVVIGASDVYSGYSACRAYEQYGITSFPYAVESVPASASVTQIKEVIRTQNPKLIVFEINSFLYEKDTNENKVANIRKYADNIPMTSNKTDYINSVATEDQIEYYIPMIKYHGLWSEYPQYLKRLKDTFDQKLRGYSVLKGYKTKNEVYSTKAKIWHNLENDESRAPLAEYGEKRLREMLEYCKSENIENIVFVRFPHVMIKKNYNRFARTNTAGDIIKSYGYDFINFERDPETDYDADMFYNPDHLNIYGTDKFTDYMCSVLFERYNLQKSELTQQQEERWDESVFYYNKLKKYVDDGIKQNREKKSLYEGSSFIDKLKDYE